MIRMPQKRSVSHDSPQFLLLCIEARRGRPEQAAWPAAAAGTPRRGRSARRTRAPRSGGCARCCTSSACSRTACLPPACRSRASAAQEPACLCCRPHAQWSCHCGCPPLGAAGHAAARRVLSPADPPEPSAAGVFRPSSPSRVLNLSEGQGVAARMPSLRGGCAATWNSRPGMEPCLGHEAENCCEAKGGVDNT